MSYHKPRPVVRALRERRAMADVDVTSRSRQFLWVPTRAQRGGLGDIFDPSTWRIGQLGAGVFKGPAMRQYTAQRNAAGATWGWNNSLGFPVPLLHMKVAFVWMQQWQQMVSAAVEQYGPSSAVMAWLNMDDKQKLGWNQLNDEYNNRWFPFVTGQMFTLPVGDGGIYAPGIAEMFWQRILPIASLMDTMPSMPTGWDTFWGYAAEEAKARVQDVKDGFATLSKAASGAFFDLALAFLEPLLPFLAVGVGGYLLLTHRGKR